MRACGDEACQRPYPAPPNDWCIWTDRALERPALQRLLADIAAGKVDIIVVYKVDRLTRSLLDFSKLVEIFDKAGVSFVSITQSFNTTTSMGRLTLAVPSLRLQQVISGRCNREQILGNGLSLDIGAAGLVARVPLIARLWESVSRSDHYLSIG